MIDFKIIDNITADMMTKNIAKTNLTVKTANIIPTANCPVCIKSKY